MLLPLTLALAACTPVLHSPVDTSEASDWVAPENSWPMAEPPAGLTGEGFGEGQVPPDFRLPDQNGEEVALWQFYGSVVVLDVSTMWCAPCQELAEGVEETYQDYLPEGFMYLTVLAQDTGGQVPDQPDLGEWVEYFGITAPVLSDTAAYTASAVPDGTYPRLIVIDRQMKVATAAVNPVSDDAVRAAIEEVL